MAAADLGLTGLVGTGAADARSLVERLGDSVRFYKIGLELLVAPFKGGTLVPAPDLLLAGLLTGPTGALILSGTWPAGIPSGFEASFQHWITDPAGPQGLAASNGLVVLVP